jgi:GrpB-like predicted nucleotidyltransferase (UPF0157 family)
MHQPDLYATWQAQFADEKVRLLRALGGLADSGVVEQIQHIGATNVPGLWASPCIDIGLSVWPFPLTAQHRAALQDLGYKLSVGEESADEQRFRHVSGTFQLFVAEAGTDRWTNYLLLLDYLREADSARQLFSAHKQAHAADPAAYAQMKAQIFPQLVAAAQAWWVDRQSFEAVESVAAELKDYPGFWAVSSGWALDLYLDRVTRVHHDVDVVVNRAEQLALQQHLSGRGWKFVTPFEGKLEPWPPYMTLELPRHQVHALREEAFIDFQLTPLQQSIWHYRRAPNIVRHLDRAVLRSVGGIPFLAPEVVLLFKSKNTSDKQERPQDQIDFEAVCSHLEPERRAWLRWALLATSAEHPWIEKLG